MINFINKINLFRCAGIKHFLIIDLDSNNGKILLIKRKEHLLKINNGNIFNNLIILHESVFEYNQGSTEIAKKINKLLKEHNLKNIPTIIGRVNYLLFLKISRNLTGLVFYFISCPPNSVIIFSTIGEFFAFLGVCGFSIFSSFLTANV